MSISRATWMKSLSDLWLKPGHAKGGRSRRTSRFNNARFASGWAAGVEMLESRAMLASDIYCTYVENGDGYNSLYIALPNDPSNPLQVQVAEYNTTVDSGKNGIQFFFTSTASVPQPVPQIVWSGPEPSGAYTTFKLNQESSYVEFSDSLITDLYIYGSSGAKTNGINENNIVGYYDINDSVLLSTLPTYTVPTNGTAPNGTQRTGNLSNVVNISANAIAFNNNLVNNAAFGIPSITASLAASTVTFETVSSIPLNTTGLPYLGSITVNGPAGADQPFAGDGSLIGPDWGSLNYAANQPIQISLTGNTMATYQVVDVIGDTLYIQGAGPGSGVYSNAAVQGLICPNTYESSVGEGLIPQVVGNKVSLTTTGDGSTIQGAIAGLYFGAAFAQCVLLGKTNNGNITLEVVKNTYATTNETLLNSLNAGSGEINLAVSGELVNESNSQASPNLVASAVGLYVTGTNSSIGDDTAYPAPITTRGNTPGVPLSLTVFAENPTAINITDVTTAGVKINSITANQGGQAPTVSSGQVEYNTTPNTTPTYGLGSSNINFNASGPIILGSVSATGVATFSGSSILQGEGQSQTIIAAQLNLNASGEANYTGSVQFIPGTSDSLVLQAPPSGTTWFTLGFRNNQTIFISAATSASNNGSFVIHSVSADGLTLSLTSRYVVTTATGVVVIGNGVIGQPGTQANGASNSISLTTVPLFQTYASNGSIYLSLGGQVNSTAYNVDAMSRNNQPSSAIIQSAASFLTVYSIIAEGGLASVAMSNGTIFQNVPTPTTLPTTPCITAPTVSLTSPYNIGTSLYPLVIDATSGILLNMTATTATSAGAYIETVDSSGNGVVPSTIGVTTYGGNVYVNNGTVATSTPMLSFTGNILSQANSAAMPTLTFSNTNGDHGSAGNVIISGLLNVDTIMAGIDVNGQPGSGQILNYSTISGQDQIRGVGARAIAPYLKC